MMKHSELQRHLAVVFAVLATGVVLGSESLRADDEIPRELVELIERIEWEEQAYRNIDATLQTRYTSTSTSPNEITEYLEQVRHARQGDRFLMEFAYTRQPDSDRTDFQHKLLASDGESLRFLATADPGADDHQLEPTEVRGHSILPHTFIQPGTRRDIPLSVLLQGGPTTYPRYEYQVSRTGTAEFNGLMCELVRLTATTTASPGRAACVSNEREYWLAVERNYIPVRVLTIEPLRSSDTPIAEGVIDEFREIAPGVWFPWRATYSLYDRRTVEDTGEQRIRWQKVHQTQSAVIDPDHPDDFFRDIGFDDLVLDPRAQ